MARLKETAAGSRPGGSTKISPSKGFKNAPGGNVPRKSLLTTTASTRKSGPAATTKYSDAKIQELKALMTSDCHYCRHDVQTDMMQGHLLYKCKGIQLPRRLQETLMKIRVEKSTIVLPEKYKWENYPEGICDLTMAKFPLGTVCAPFNYLYLAMDKTTTKAISAIRGSSKAFVYEDKKTGLEQRKRFYADKKVHEEWESIVREKIAAGDVTEVLIPVTFRYWLAKYLRNLEDRNHCALIVLKITDGKWKFSMYDSQMDNRYYARATSEEVRKFLVRRLLGNMEAAPKEHVKDRWLRQEPIYCSLSGDGCQAVVVFWVHLRYMGKEISNPNNTATVDFFKAIMFQAADEKNPHPLMRGEKFDLEWKINSIQKYDVADPDPELQGHVEDFIAAIKKLHAQE